VEELSRSAHDSRQRTPGCPEKQKASEKEEKEKQGHP
jgi:hypothetical protein